MRYFELHNLVYIQQHELKQEIQKKESNQLQQINRKRDKQEYSNDPRVLSQSTGNPRRGAG